MARKNLTSFRFDDEVAEIIDNFKLGKNRNDKLNNYVLYHYEEVPRLRARIKELEKLIEELRTRL